MRMVFLCTFVTGHRTWTLKLKWIIFGTAKNLKQGLGLVCPNGQRLFSDRWICTWCDYLRQNLEPVEIFILPKNTIITFVRYTKVEASTSDSDLVNAFKISWTLLFKSRCLQHRTWNLKKFAFWSFKYLLWQKKVFFCARSALDRHPQHGFSWKLVYCSVKM